MRLRIQPGYIGRVGYLGALLALTGTLLLNCGEMDDSPFPSGSIEAVSPPQRTVVPHTERHPLHPGRDDVERRLPDPRGGSGGYYCDPTYQPLITDVASWAQAADDIVMGTLDSLTPAWEPLWRPRTSVRGFLDPSECLEGDPALDLHLVEVESLLGNDIPHELTVRIGYGFIGPWDNAVRVDFGSDVVDGWLYDRDSDPPRQPPLESGMRVGGAIYQHAAIDAPVFVPNSEPLFEVLDGRVWFQQAPRSECANYVAWPDLGALDGRDVCEVGAALREAQASESALLVEEHRAHLGVDSPAEEEVGTVTYGAQCRHRVGEEWGEYPTYECETDADCWEGDICLRGGCVPARSEGSDWEVHNDDG